MLAVKCLATKLVTAGLREKGRAHSLLKTNCRVFARVGELRKRHLPGTCVGCGLGWSGRGGVQVWPGPCLPQQPSGRADQGYREKYFIVQYAGARGPTSELYSFSVKLWRALRIQTPNQLNK